MKTIFILFAMGRVKKQQHLGHCPNRGILVRDLNVPTYIYFYLMCLMNSVWSETKTKLIKLYLTPSHPIIKAKKDNTHYDKMPQIKNILSVI